MDLELLLRLARPRNLALILAAIAAVRFLPAYQVYPRRLYRSLVYPPLKDSSREGQDILDRLDEERRLRVEARFKAVDALLDQARARGVAVDGLREKARAALLLNTAQYRNAALKALNDVEMAIPQAASRYIPASPPSAEEMEVPRDVTPRSAGKRKKGKARGRKSAQP